MGVALNKVVEEVAKKQVEDMIVLMEMLSEQIIATSKTAKANQIQFATPSTSNGDLNKKLVESQTIIKKLQTEYNKLQDSYAQLAKKVDNYTTAKKNNTTAITNNSVAQSQLLKLTKEEEVLNTGLTTYIQKLSVERIRASRTVADYNAQIALGTKLTDAQTAELAAATIQFQKYDNAIKAGKKSIGDSREYVGQYERANIGLSNSVAQIARELPAATYGFQTFALGISNNFPIMVDEIRKAIAINKELIAQGKPVENIWKQIGSAILSFNTIMSIGLLLLALYGKEIASFTKQLLGLNDAINFNEKSFIDAYNAQEKYLLSLAEGSKQTRKDYDNIVILTKSLKDNSKSQEEKLNIAERIKKMYPGYLDNYSKEQIILYANGKANKELSKTMNQLTKDIKLRNDAEAQSDSANRLFSNIADLKEEIKLRENINKTINVRDYNTREFAKQRTKERVDLLNDDEEFIKKYGQTTLDVFGQYDTKQIRAMKEGLNILVSEYNRERLSINDKIVATSLLDFNPESDSIDKNTKSIKLNTKAKEDYLASEYELWKLRKTNETNLNKEIMEDEASSYDLRLLASERYHDNSIELSQREAQEQQRVLKYNLDQRNNTLDVERQNEINQLNTQLKNQQISQSDYYLKLKDIDENYNYDKLGIEKNYQNESLIIQENYAQSYLNINKEMIGKMIELYDTINFQKADLEIAQVDLKGVEKLKDVLASIGDNMSIEEIRGKLDEVNSIANDNAIDLSKRNAKRELDEKEARANRIIDEIALLGVLNGLTDEEIANQIYSNQELIKLDKELIESKKKVTEADNEETKKQISNKLQLLDETRKINQQTFEMQVELGHAIADLANQLFSNSIDKYDRQIEKSNEYYDKLIANAEKGSEQELLLQEEKERREDELQKRKIEVQRRQAVFNKIIAIAEVGIELGKTIAKINLAAAVLKALSATNPSLLALLPAVLAQIPIAAATSAIQIGTILATPLPQYEKGRLDGPAETALINEKRIEPVESKDGKVKVYSGRNRIVNLKAGDIVHKSVEDFQKNKMSLENASIMASFVNQANQLQAFDNYLGKELNGLSGKIEKGIEKGFKKAKINNNNQINFDFGKKPSNFFN